MAACKSSLILPPRGRMMELGVNEIIAKAVTPLHGRILQKLGVKRVIYPERDMAMRVAHSLVVRPGRLAETPFPGGLGNRRDFP